jgi:hypothetical protein
MVKATEEAFMPLTATVSPSMSARRSISLAMLAGFSIPLGVVHVASAQWSTSATASTPIAIGTGDQGVPLLVPGAGATAGNWWLSFTDTSQGGGIKYIIQRINPQGEGVFAPVGPGGPGGVVLSPSRTNSASFLYDIATDPSSGGVVAAYDNNGIWVQKVSPDGTKLWGNADGVLVPASSGGVGPQVAALSSGGAVVVWGSGITLTFQWINADGSLGVQRTISETGRAQSPADIVAVGDGSDDVIALWVRAEGTNIVTSRKGLRIQRMNSATGQVWNAGQPVSVYTSSATPSKGIQTGYQPRLWPDGQGGAYTAWYDTGATRAAWLQHYEADGTARFPAEGFEVSGVPSGTEFRLGASVTYHRGVGGPLGSYTVAFTTSNTTQSQFGLKAQRVVFDPPMPPGPTPAQRVWAPEGVAIVPVVAGTFPISFVNVVGTSAPAAPGEGIITWLQFAGTSTPQSVQAIRLTTAGVPSTLSGWPTTGGIAGGLPTLTLADASTGKGRLATAISPDGPWLASVWADGAAGSFDVRGALLSTAGELGRRACGASDVASANQGIGPDAQLTADDIIVFLGWYFANDARADVAGPNQSPTPDTQFTADDIIVFLGRFFAGC